MTRPLAAAALLAGVLAILYTTSWAQQPDTEPIAEEVVEDPFGQPRHNDPFSTLPREGNRSERGDAHMAPPGSYHPVEVRDRLVVVNTRTGQSHQFTGGEWSAYSPPVRPDAGESTEEESQLRAQEEQLQRQILKMHHQINYAQQQLKQLELERSRLLQKARAGQ